MKVKSFFKEKLIYVERFQLFPESILRDVFFVIDYSEQKIKQSSPSSMTSSGRTVTANPKESNSIQQKYNEIQEKLSFDRLLQEADLDRGVLLQVLNELGIHGLQELNNAHKLQEVIGITRERMERNSSSSIRASKGNSRSNSFSKRAPMTMTTTATATATAMSTGTTNGSKRQNTEQMNSEDDDDNDNMIESSYSIRQFSSEIKQFKEEMETLGVRIQCESVMNEMIKAITEKVETSHLNELLKEKLEIQRNQLKFESQYNQDLQALQLHIDSLQQQIASEKKYQENYLLTKIALDSNVITCGNTLDQLKLQRRKFALLKDVSQLSNASKNRILRYTYTYIYIYIYIYKYMYDWYEMCLSCKAWYYNLYKPEFVMRLAKGKLRHYCYEPKMPLRTYPKQVKRAVMTLKFNEMNTSSLVPRRVQPKADDIYQRCMQQLQIFIAQAEQDRDELEERQNLLKFMQTSLFDRIHELSQLRVRKWQVEHKLYEGAQEKKTLNGKIRQCENELKQRNAIIEDMKQTLKEQELQRQRKFKVQSDLVAVKRGSQDLGLENELNKVKTQKKRLVKALMQIREEIAKREDETKKFQSRVETLEDQYKLVLAKLKNPKNSSSISLHNHNTANNSNNNTNNNTKANTNATILP
ncbi:hypothetical protein RFI_38292 [Reticulomyxa filosa]|uniref:Uncharacterized protein n=2 Tax=Reticulomyxa filosa TaxID=46433 RepID=X6LAX9_RETFI|nr:hypothetical protein RFI_38292 [Reticulomyxa filosa]|eukprot:ETN99187.1 hypothetical protein RFI_38292 [Reticulomyxa filosa]